MYITIGGAPEYKNKEYAFKEINRILKENKINKKDIKMSYAVGDHKEDSTTGGFIFAKEWAEKNKVTFGDGTPKFKFPNGSWNNNAVEERNKALASRCSIFINLVSGNSTGGNKIIAEFESYGVPVYRIEDKETKAFIPEPELLEKSILIYSKFAQAILPKAVTLDVETTGLSEHTDDIIEIAVMEADSEKVLLDTFTYTETPISPYASEVNGITADMIEGMPLFHNVFPKSYNKFKNKIIVASNSDFDEKMVLYGLLKAGQEPITNTWVCLQRLYRKYSCQNKKQVPSLNTAKIAQQLGIQAGTHRALNDVIAQNKILQAMANKVVPNFELN